MTTHDRKDVGQNVSHKLISVVPWRDSTQELSENSATRVKRNPTYPLTTHTDIIALIALTPATYTAPHRTTPVP